MSTVPLDAIVIGSRVRKDLGDLSALAESIKRHGLLHPIVITQDNTLVAGHRRIEAAKLIGWNEIPATVLDIADLLSAERDENAERKDFTPSEAVEIGGLIEDQHRAKVAAQSHEQRVFAAKSSVAKRTGNAMPIRNPACSPLGAAMNVAAKAVGMGREKYLQAKTIVQAAKTEPEQFGDLQHTMDETGNVFAAHQELQRRQGAATRGRKPRHPVHKKMHYPKPNRTVERATWALAGICDSLEAVDEKELDPEKIGAWVDSLKKSAAHINRITKRFING